MYQFHRHSAKSNELLKVAVMTIRQYLGYGKTVVLLHHTHKLADDKIGWRKNRTTSRNTGVRVWSDKVLGGGVFKRLADTIICQERQEKRDSSGEVEEWTIDLQAYGRLGEDSPLLSFAPDGERKYMRHLVRDLSKGARSLLDAMRIQRGPWKSRHEASKCMLCATTTAYIYLAELRAKGHITIANDGSVHLGPPELTVGGVPVGESRAPADKDSVAEWLLGFMGGPGSVQPVADVRQPAEDDGLSWETVRSAKRRPLERSSGQQRYPDGFCGHT